MRMLEALKQVFSSILFGLFACICMAEAQGIPPGFQEPSAPDTPRLGVA